MSKNSVLNHKLLSKTNIALLCIFVMMVGFLISRAALSIAVIVFGVNALWNIHPRRWLRERWWLLGVAWVFCYIISYFWSNDIGYWSDRLEVKLPVLLLPLAFSFLPAFSEKQLRVFTVGVSLILLSSIAYSLGMLLENPDFYIDRYYRSNVLPVLAKQDHIRYSLTLSLFTVWCIYFWPGLRTASLKWFTGIAVGIFIIFLHLLAVRTGLVTLYLFLFIWAVYAGLKRGRLVAVGLVVFICLAMFAASKWVPTLKNRIGYVSYSYTMFQEGERSGIYSDIGRFISYDVALRIIRANPIAGVGAGDILNEMKAVYRQQYPDVDDAHILIPHNQFMIVCLAGGIPALLLFGAWLFAPLRKLRWNRKSVFFLSTWLMLFATLWIEPMLEVQFGVFVFLFFLLWQRHAFIHHRSDERNDFDRLKTDDELHTDISA